MSAIVKGAWWIAAAQPIILSFGAAFAALNLDLQPLLATDLKNMLIFKNDKDEKQVKEVIEAKEI